MRWRLALLALLAAAPAAAQDDAARWLVRMTEALARLDYQGDLVYAHGGQVESLRIFHASAADGGRERLISLNGPPREVIRAAGQVTCIGLGSRPAVYGDAAAIALPAMSGFADGDAQRLLPHYSLHVGATERVADLDAQLIEIRPGDAYRYGYRLWLELESGMLLKSVRFGADGRPVEQLMFTRIVIGERPSDAELEGDGSTLASVPLIRDGAAQSMSEWAVIEPPAGFRGNADATPDAGHRVYSDGIANVSIYVEPLSRTAPAFSGPASRGAINLYGRVLDGMQVTVLGDVPAATVERFAQGVVLNRRGAGPRD